MLRILIIAIFSFLGFGYSFADEFPTKVFRIVCEQIDPEGMFRGRVLVLEQTDWQEYSGAEVLKIGKAAHIDNVGAVLRIYESPKIPKDEDRNAFIQKLIDEMSPVNGTDMNLDGSLDGVFGTVEIGYSNLHFERIGSPMIEFTLHLASLTTGGYHFDRNIKRDAGYECRELFLVSPSFTKE